MFGVDRFDAILPPGTVSVLLVFKYGKRLTSCSNQNSDASHENDHSMDLFVQGAIMAVGASEPTVVATKDGRIGMKNQMQV